MTAERLHVPMSSIDLFVFVVFSTSMLLLFSCRSASDGSAAKKEEPSSLQYLAYFGTYTTGDSKGIYAYRFDPSSGRMTEIGLAAEVPNPSFIAVHPNNRNLYAVSQGFEGQGAVIAYEIDKPSGKLTLLNQVSSKGSGPCHANVDATGKMLVVANYGSGSTVSFPVHQDGSRARLPPSSSTRARA